MPTQQTKALPATTQTKIYTVEDIYLSNNKITTTDGLYQTKRDNECFSYWYDKHGRMGHTSFDYVFACQSGLSTAVEKLNEILHTRDEINNKFKLLAAAL